MFTAMSLFRFIVHKNDIELKHNLKHNCFVLDCPVSPSKNSSPVFHSSYLIEVMASTAKVNTHVTSMLESDGKLDRATWVIWAA